MTRANLSSNFYKLNIEWIYKGKPKPIYYKVQPIYKIKNINSQKYASMKI